MAGGFLHNSRKTMHKSLDLYVPWPDEQKAYLARHGWHFSKKAYLYAAERMYSKTSDGREEKVKTMTYDEVEDLLKRQNVTVKNDNGYDKLYVAAMCKADYWGSSIDDEMHMAKFIKDYLDDPDGSDEKAMRHFYFDMVAQGVSIPWDELI